MKYAFEYFAAATARRNELISSLMNRANDCAKIALEDAVKEGKFDTTIAISGGEGYEEHLREEYQSKMTDLYTGWGFFIEWVEPWVCRISFDADEWDKGE